MSSVLRASAQSVTRAADLQRVGITFNKRSTRESHHVSVEPQTLVPGAIPCGQ